MIVSVYPPALGVGISFTKDEWAFITKHARSHRKKQRFIEEALALGFGLFAMGDAVTKLEERIKHVECNMPKGRMRRRASRKGNAQSKGKV